jgi:arylsulfatase A-like enzyme
MEKQKSLVLVTVDCLRADHAGFMGYDRPTTPFLNKLAEESLVFPAAIVAGAPTYYSFPAILASRYPLALGRDVLGIAPGETTLASALHGAGYPTAAFIAANPYLSARFGYDQGFTHFQDFLDDGLNSLSDQTTASSSSKANGWCEVNRRLDRWTHAFGPLGSVYDSLYFQYCQRWATPPPDSLDALRRFPAADTVVDQALEWLSSAAQGPFFLWLHLMDPHAPYYPKQEALQLMEARAVTPFRARYLNSSWNRSDLSLRALTKYRNDIIALYDAGIRWVDVQIGRLVQRLQEWNRWQDCVFALTADHGEEFLDHGGSFHPPSRLTEEVIRVPLLMRVPGTSKRELPQLPFSLLHLAPTLLEVLQIPILAGFQGTSCWREIAADKSWEGLSISESIAQCNNPFRRANRLGSRILVVREGRMKLVLHTGSGVEELYDLQTDPREKAPLPRDAERAARRRLLERARVHVQDSRSKRDPEMRLRATLRDLQQESLQGMPSDGVLG